MTYRLIALDQATVSTDHRFAERLPLRGNAAGRSPNPSIPA
ncbi:hypothetical protein ACRS6B_06900 [Nocardia asteroides]